MQCYLLVRIDSFGLLDCSECHFLRTGYVTVSSVISVNLIEYICPIMFVHFEDGYCHFGNAQL